MNLKVVLCVVTCCVLGCFAVLYCLPTQSSDSMCCEEIRNTGNRLTVLGFELGGKSPEDLKFDEQLGWKEYDGLIKRSRSFYGSLWCIPGFGLKCCQIPKPFYGARHAYLLIESRNNTVLGVTVVCEGSGATDLLERITRVISGKFGVEFTNESYNFSNRINALTNGKFPSERCIDSDDVKYLTPCKVAKGEKLLFVVQGYAHRIHMFGQEEILGERVAVFVTTSDFSRRFLEAKDRGEADANHKRTLERKAEDNDASSVL